MQTVTSFEHYYYQALLLPGGLRTPSAVTPANLYAQVPIHCLNRGGRSIRGSAKVEADLDAFL